MAFYELVNLSSGNRVGDYDTEEAALRDAWDVIERRGRDAVATIALGYETDEGYGRIIAEGDDLANRAARMYGAELAPRPDHSPAVA